MFLSQNESNLSVFLQEERYNAYMIVLHVSWFKDHFYGWAEEITPQHSSFFSDEDLLLWLEGILGKPIHQNQLCSMVGLFPCNQEGQPIYSFSVQEEVPLDSFQSFPISSYAFHFDEYQELFRQVAVSSNLGEEIQAGSDLQFWANMYLWVLKTISHNAFYPTIVHSSDDIQSNWKLMYTQKDFPLLESFVQDMPDSTWCIGASLHDIQNQSSFGALQAALQSTTNSWMRSQKEILPQIPHIVNDKTPQACDSIAGEKWFESLQSVQPSINAPKDTMPFFTEQLQSWQNHFHLQKGLPFRIFIRIHEPGNNHPENWQVECTIQSLLQPKSCIPISFVFQNPEDIAQIYNLSPTEFLTDFYFLLGCVDRYVPHEVLSLSPAKPFTWNCTIREMYNLWEWAEMGNSYHWIQFGFPFTVDVTDNPPIQLTARIHSFTNASSFFSIQNLVNFDWKISVGDDSLSQEEWKQLIDNKIPLLRKNGKWKLYHRAFLESVDTLMHTHKKKPSLQSLLYESFAGNQSYIPVSLDFSDQFSHFKSILAGTVSLDDFVFPECIDNVLRHYQKKGVAWLWNMKKVSFNPILADDMGLGKTLQILTLLQKEKEESPSLPPSLVICPTSVLSNWKEEAERFIPSLSLFIHHGSDRLKSSDFAQEIRKHDIVLTSYSLALRDTSFLTKTNWNAVILDEAQNIKNPQAKQTQAIKKLQSSYRIALTGTPVENHVGDLWSIFDFLQPGWLGNETQFKMTFFNPIHRDKDPNKTLSLKKMTQPFILRRLKTDATIIPDLPDKIETKEYCFLTKEQISLYEACLQSSLRDIESTEGIERKGRILTLLLHLKQICNHPAHFLKENTPRSSSKSSDSKTNIIKRSGKIKRLWELLQEVMEENEKVLLFTQYREMGWILQSILETEYPQQHCFFHGGLTRKKRDELIQKFQEETDMRIMVLSLKAGGTGLNLTAANHVFHVDRWWNPAVENQATDRVFRIGQQKNVHVHKMICKGTMEESIDQLMESKLEMADKIIGDTSSQLTEMSLQQLKSLFSLRKDALDE